MKLSPDFEKFLSFIPEILSRDESFLKDLESCTPVSYTHLTLPIWKVVLEV